MRVFRSVKFSSCLAFVLLDGIDEDGALEALTDPVAAAALKKKRALIHAGMGSALDGTAPHPPPKTCIT
jgi:hypothetical protein